MLYDNLEPGGWFEQIKIYIRCECDDESIPPESVILTWGPSFFAAGENLGKSLDITKAMRLLALLTSMKRPKNGRLAPGHEINH